MHGFESMVGDGISDFLYCTCTGQLKVIMGQRYR